MASDFPIAALLDALDEPAMLIRGATVTSANAAARALFGAGIEGSDVRLVIRHPLALDFILPGRDGDIELVGIGSLGRPWQLRLRRVADKLLFLRLIDRSATHAAEKMRVDFVANASHELRTPLSVILGYAESLEDGAVEPQDCGRFGGIIRSEAKRMLRIIEDLMSLSRIEADRFVAATDRVAIAHVVRSAVDNNNAVAAQCGCRIKLTLDDGLPEVAGDFPQLLQLCDNLISNAVRYGCSGPGDEIEVSASRGRPAGQHCGSRPWPGHRARAFAADHRAILPRRPSPQPRQRRHRARPCDRQAYRRAPPRLARRRQRRRRGHDGHRQASGRAAWLVT